MDELEFKVFNGLHYEEPYIVDLTVEHSQYYLTTDYYLTVAYKNMQATTKQAVSNEMEASVDPALLAVHVLERLVKDIGEHLHLTASQMHKLYDECMYQFAPKNTNTTSYTSYVHAHYVFDVDSESFTEQVKSTYAQFKANNDNSIIVKSRELPGVDSYVPPGCDCSFVYSDIHPNKVHLWKHIQHLNDQHRWSREKIADWLDGLADEGIINIDFEPWEEDKENDNE